MEDVGKRMELRMDELTERQLRNMVAFCIGKIEEVGWVKARTWVWMLGMAHYVFWRRFVKTGKKS